MVATSCCNKHLFLFPSRWLRAHRRLVWDSNPKCRGPGDLGGRLLESMTFDDLCEGQWASMVRLSPRVPVKAAAMAAAAAAAAAAAQEADDEAGSAAGLAPAPAPRPLPGSDKLPGEDAIFSLGNVKVNLGPPGDNSNFNT